MENARMASLNRLLVAVMAQIRLHLSAEVPSLGGASAFALRTRQPHYFLSLGRFALELLGDTTTHL